MCHGKRQLIQFFLIRIMTWSPSARKGSNEMSNKLTTSIMHKINFSSQRVYRGQKKKEGKRRGKWRHFGAKAFDWKEKRNVSISGYKMSVCFLRFASACLPCCCSKKKKWYVMNTNKQCLSPLLTPLALGKSCLSSCMVIEKKEAEATNICSDEATSKTISCETYRFVMWCDVKCDSRFGLFFYYDGNILLFDHAHPHLILCIQRRNWIGSFFAASVGAWVWARKTKLLLCEGMNIE